jgi:hypothetical protein
MDTASALSRNPDLLRRIGVTLAALVVYRAGCWIPLPGVDANALAVNLGPEMLSGGVERLSVMALGIVPLLSALLIVEAVLIAWPPLRAWASDAENRSVLDGWTLAVAFVFAGLQANAIAVALEGVSGVVANPGLAFRAGVVVSMVAGTAIVVWLASFITQHGIGSGFWILLAVPHVVSFTQGVLVQSSLWGPGALALSIGFLALAAAVFAALVKTRPPLARAEELLWTPLLGFAVPGWLLLVAAALIWWLATPGPLGARLAEIATFQALSLAALIAIPLVLLLRRRSFGVPLTRAAVAAAVLPAAALVLLAAAGMLISQFPAQPLLPGSPTTLILAAVGVAVICGLEEAKPAAVAAREARPSNPLSPE